MSTTKKLDLQTFFRETVKCIKEGKTKAEFATYMDGIYGRGKSELGVEEYWYTKYQQGLRTRLNNLLKEAEKLYENDKSDVNKQRVEDAQNHLDATAFPRKNSKKDGVQHLDEMLNLFKQVRSEEKQALNEETSETQDEA